MRHLSLPPAIVLSVALLCSVAARADTFAFDDVARDAAALARQPYRVPPVAAPQLASLSYDAYRSIRFKPDHGLWRGSGLPWQVQFFSVGRGFPHALRLDEVVAGSVRPLAIPAAAFDSGDIALPDPAPVAGLRLVSPFIDGRQWNEVIAFLGASYFRAVGRGQGYGASARAVAVDTVGGRGEEFPAFTRFWIERPEPGAAAAVVLDALLDGPRVVGAYRFTVRPGETTTVDVRARLHLRGPVAMLGIAPLTSMYLAGENQPGRDDFRPEVHDSDGLQIALAGGEWLWRPLVNPGGTFVTSFAARAPRGFGLMQRDRRFASYEDLEAHYERRPSVWVEPLGDWGPGRIELLQFHTPDETNDNVVAYWVPDALPAAGAALDIAWRLHWSGADARRPPGAMALQTRAGHGFRSAAPAPGWTQLHVDFDDPGVAIGHSTASAGGSEGLVSTLDASAGVEAVCSGNANVRGLQTIVQPNAGRGGWRVTLDYERVDPRQAVELRLFLRRNGQAISETWSYAIGPEA